MSQIARKNVPAPIGLIAELTLEVTRLAEANAAALLLARSPDLHLSHQLKAQFVALDELVQSLKLRIQALSR
ncbi:hypothetical protein U91I_02165 [alpha proteobacterium U9-1i]|nr:hypothetical protein U91I_02165 [alpha proteobacterium U9-1i]